MKPYSKLRFILGMIPALIGWAALMLVIWGLVFLRLTDAPRQNKLTIYFDGQTPGSKQVVLDLEDKYLSGEKNCFPDAEIKMIKLRPFDYAVMGEEINADADIFIISEANMEKYSDWLMPFEKDMAGALLSGPENGFWQDGNLIYDKTQNYYICVSATSPHSGEEDYAARLLALCILSETKEGEIK